MYKLWSKGARCNYICIAAVDKYIYLMDLVLLYVCRPVQFPMGGTHSGHWFENSTGKTFLANLYQCTHLSERNVCVHSELHREEVILQYMHVKEQQKEEYFM